MTGPAFAAALLSSSAAGLARLATERMLPRLQQPVRYGESAAELWKDHLTCRLSDLALALAEGRPEHFAEQVGWARVAFTARGVPGDDLLAGLQCLREVLAAELPAEAAAVSRDYLDQALARWDELGRPEPSALAAGNERGRLAARYVVALLEGDRRGACELVLAEVRAGRLAARGAILEVCLPAQKELGRLWHLDEITVAEEHFVTATTVRLLAQLLALAPAAAPTGRTVVAAALAGDDHDMGLRALADLLELDGWRAVFLGNNLPIEDLAWAVEAFGADLVLVSATLMAHAHQVRDAIARLRARGGARGDGQAPPVLVGGPAFAADDDLWRRVGADAGARSLEEALSVARRLVGLPARG